MVWGGLCLASEGQLLGVMGPYHSANLRTANLSHCNTRSANLQLLKLFMIFTYQKGVPQTSNYKHKQAFRE